MSGEEEGLVAASEDDLADSAPPRRNPRLLEYARKTSPVPKASVKNFALIMLLLAGLGALGSGIYAKRAALTVSAVVFVLGWCCCPWCALERTAKSSELSPLMAGGDDNS